MYVDSFFMIVNFIVRIGFGMYLCYRYIIPYLVQFRRQEEQEEVRLQEVQRSIYSSYEEILDVVDDQEKEFLTLQKKFRLWNKTVDEQEKQQKDVLEERKKKIEDLLELKLNNQERSQLIKVQMPLIIKDVRGKFAKTADNSFKKKYVTDLLRVIKE